MSGPVDLLLITWNRLEYVQKTVDQLLRDPADFRLYFWDNASTDGTADLIASLDDPRIVQRHMSPENVKQREPSLWFFEQATSDLGGKIDDDILLPHGWTERVAPALRREARLGMVGCWVFMEEDWDDELAVANSVEMGGVRVLRSLSRAGQSFLARVEYLQRYIREPGSGHGFPVDQHAMSLDGLVNGTLVPPLFAHNMDDPRSEYCLMRRDATIGKHGALSAQVRGFQTPEEYLEWIRQDAHSKLVTPVESMIREARLRRDRSLLGRVRWKLHRAFHPNPKKG
ncbi:MAG: glycosyltransferase family 2 protein [bacterium]|nr:glycosyltransferase family 2 protein [bacterium]